MAANIILGGLNQKIKFSNFFVLNYLVGRFCIVSSPIQPLNYFYCNPVVLKVSNDLFPVFSYSVPGIQVKISRHSKKKADYLLPRAGLFVLSIAALEFIVMFASGLPPKK